MLTNLKGPILVLGAGGFIGSNLFWRLRDTRSDVYGTRNSHFPHLWPINNVFDLDLEKHARAVIELAKPATIFDCVAYGGYLLQTDAQRTYRTNVLLKETLLALAHEYKCDYIHGGSSSEYGAILDAPSEDTTPKPHTHYAVSKYAAASMVHFYGKHRNLRCANLRLYAVYGPGEREDNRLIPQLVKAGLRGEYPPFVHPSVTRDFIHVNDVCDAYITTALNLKPEHYGESFNIGTGRATSIQELAALAKDIFDLEGEPTFSMPDREYDFRGAWRADPLKANVHLRWNSRIRLREGLRSLTQGLI